MVRDCRAGLPEGWSYFLTRYVPAVRRLIAHYAPEKAGDAETLGRILLALRRPGSSVFESVEPAPERQFVADLRQAVLAEIEAPPADVTIDLAGVAEALAPLTITEKQAAWLEAMRYTPQETAPMLRVSAATVEKIRERAAELIRGKMDAWRRTLLADNGVALGREAAAAGGADCLPAKAFLDVLDGRTTWAGREVMERHAGECWHCVDHFCRMVEVVELLRGIRPLEEAEAAPLRKLLGLAEPKAGGWKRFFGGG